MAEAERERRAEEAAAAIEAANRERGERAMERRPTVGSPQRLVRGTRNNYGYMERA